MTPDETEETVDRDNVFAVIICTIILWWVDLTPWFDLSLGVITAPIWVTFMIGFTLFAFGAEQE